MSRRPLQGQVPGLLAAVLATLAGTACAGGAAQQETKTMRRQVDTMRARSADDARTIRRLEDRVFLLEDQLETAKLQRGGAAADPAVPAPPAEAAPLPKVERTTEPPVQGVVADSLDGGLTPEPGVQVVYEGEALDPRGKRIVLGDDRLGAIDRLSNDDIPTPRRRRAGAPTLPTAAQAISKPPSRPGLPDPNRVTDKIGVAPIPGAPAGRPAAARSAPPTKDDDAGPERAYRAAVDALKGHEHQAAIAGLRSFIVRWPAHDFADNAQYWLGEAFYDQRDYKTALAEFKKVLEKYPRGNKAPDAQLKIGLTLNALGDTAGARTALGAVTTNYPASDAARIAGERLADLKSK